MSTDNGYATGSKDGGYGRCVEIDSPALGRAMPVLVFLPADYDESEVSYPTCYLLHGVNKQPISAG